MILIKFLIAFLTISVPYKEANANMLRQKVPGKDYTYGELRFRRQQIRDMRERNKPEKLDGAGVDLFGNVEIVENKETKLKDYLVFIRNCGKIKLSNKEESQMKQLKNGTRVVLRLKESFTCEVSDWRLF